MPAPHVRALLAIATLLASAVSAQAAGKKFAILVGVREYESASFANLQYTENDAEELASVLKDAGYDEVVVLTTTRGKKDKALAPTTANIRAALKKLSGKVKRDDLLLVGLAGHGLQWPVRDPKTKKDRDESFFCPADARPRSKQSLEELEKTMISLGELFRTLDESGAGVRLMLVDACRNEVNGEKRNVDIDNLPRAKKGTAVLFSCKGGETAHETKKLGKGHGVFFYHVIEALKGEAKDKRGQVTWASLADHVIEKVSEEVPTLIGEGAKQTPHEIRNIEGRSPLLVKVGKPDEAEKLYREGLDVCLGLTKGSDTARALESLEQASQKGHPLAPGWVGLIVFQGLWTEKDEAGGLEKIKAAMPAIRKKAEQGDAASQFLMGMYCLNGLGMKKDEKEAVSWYRKAADGGCSGAINDLGNVYRSGQGVKKDEKKAVSWYRKAADKGHSLAMVNLGASYANGDGVDKDDREALKWFRLASDNGEGFAMNWLGYMYQNGRGVKKDEKEAARWYRKAADRRYPTAMANLGFMCASGLVRLCQLSIGRVSAMRSR